MADSFFVTTPATTVTIGADRRAQLAVTVTNVSGHPVRARLRLVPIAPTQAGWLAIAGEADRQYGLGATENYTVLADVPAGTPAGSYSFRCDAAAQENPEEDFAQGPTVALTVVAEPTKRPFPWWIIVLAATVVAVGTTLGIVISHTGTATATVPQVTALPASAGIGVLKQAGFTPDPAGAGVQCDAQIASQTPPANTKAKKGSTVKLTFASCVVIVPEVSRVGLTCNQAAAIIQNAGLVADSISGSAFAQVIDQFPLAGTQVPRGAHVLLSPCNMLGR
jgi:eukaryotic-like serine/threonine-protein kinase